jgi:hypothetical protein
VVLHRDAPEALRQLREDAGAETVLADHKGVLPGPETALLIAAADGAPQGKGIGVHRNPSFQRTDDVPP